MKKMLSCIDAHELAEWRAYEMHTGPIGPQWRDEMTATQVELIQTTNRLIGAQYKKNPAPEPKHVPRPDELMKDPKRRD